MNHMTLPEPEEDDGDEGDDEEHEEADGDPDEGGRVQAERLGGGQVDHHLFKEGQICVINEMKMAMNTGGKGE